MSKELEALEELNIVLKTNIGTKRYSDIFENCLITPIKNALKVFDIISDKICVDFFIGLDNEYVYVLKLKNDKHFIQITKEEYDLLKEVLK